MKKYSFLNLYIIIKAVFYTARTCLRAVIRNTFGKITRHWCDRELHGWAVLMTNLLKINIKIVNPNNIAPQPGQPTIIMCNHTSLYDIPLSYVVFPKHSIRMLAKKELGKIPVFGSASRAAEFPFIDRKNLKQAINDLKSLENLMQSGIVMWIYAEGTRSKNGKLQPLKKGGFITAIQTHATIIPVGIRGAVNILPSKTAVFKRNQAVEIHIGEPIQAQDYSLDNKEELIQKTYTAMLKLTGEN